MARPDSTIFGVIFVTVIISQWYHVSFAQQQCAVTCTQTAVIRERTYSDVLEVAQNREWELEDDFGGDLLDIIRKYKSRSKKSVTVGAKISKISAN